jgi:hypothetical protein
MTLFTLSGSECREIFERSGHRPGADGFRPPSEMNDPKRRIVIHGSNQNFITVSSSR